MAGERELACWCRVARLGDVATLSDFRAFVETIPREFLVAMADTAEREDRLEELEQENASLRLRLALATMTE